MRVRRVEYLGHWRLVVVFVQEVDVTPRDESLQRPAHRARVCDGNARETVVLLHAVHVSQRVVRTQHDRVCDEALAVLLQRESGMRTVMPVTLIPSIINTC